MKGRLLQYQVTTNDNDMFVLFKSQKCQSKFKETGAVRSNPLCLGDPELHYACVIQ